MATVLHTIPFGLTAWKVVRNGKEVGIIRKVPHECHCENFGKWKYCAYTLKNKQIGINQFSLLNARNLFKNMT